MIDINQDAIFECIPNVSEGRRAEVIEKIVSSCRNIAGVKLLHVDSSVDSNRTVLTLVGKAQGLIDAVLAIGGEATKLIDMHTHTGNHPRTGALDVVPFVPLQNATMADASKLAEFFAKEFHAKFGVPTVLYGEAAKQAPFKDLANIRRGNYEGLDRRYSRRELVVDFGESALHRKSGLTSVGARGILVAYNVNLSTPDVVIAQKIAAQIRTSGEEGRASAMPHLKAIGWYLPSRRCAQVSCNLSNYLVTSPINVYRAVAKVSEEYGVHVN